MNTATQASSGRAKGAAKHSVAQNNPITFFEAQVKSVWSSDAESHQKATQLYRLSDLMQNYIKKARSLMESASTTTEDEWNSLCCSRAVSYLGQLAVDTRKLAIQCQRELAGLAK